MNPNKNVIKYIDIVAVLFTHGNVNLRIFPFPKCKHLFISKCDVGFISKNINDTNFPKLKTISFKKIDFNPSSVEKLQFDNAINIIEYDNIKLFDMYYFNNFTCVGNYKNFDININHLQHSI